MEVVEREEGQQPGGPPRVTALLQTVQQEWTQRCLSNCQVPLGVTKNVCFSLLYQLQPNPSRNYCRDLQSSYKYTMNSKLKSIPTLVLES